MNSFADLEPPSRDAVRWRSLDALFSLAVAGALAGTLVACGGGGGGDGAVPAPAPAPSPSPAPAPLPSSPLAAQLTVPTPTGYDADRLAAFNRLNQIRLSAGLGMVAQNAMMDEAAQAHAQWMLANDSFTHGETAGTQGFTGENWSRRDEAFGYVPVGGGEVMAQGPASAAVDALANAVYHRAIILAIEPVDVGIGWSDGGAADVRTPLVIDVTRPASDASRALGQMAQPSIHGAAVWPLDGAVGVPVRLGLETPNPVPTQDVLTLGTPISVNVERLKTISATQFTLTDGTTGEVVATRLLTNGNDTNFMIPESFIAAIPLAPLAPYRLYRADFSGKTVQFLSGAVQSVVRTWSFTTGAS